MTNENDSGRPVREVAFAKQRLRASLGLGAGLSGVGSTTMAQIGSTVDEQLRQSAARERVHNDADLIAQARAEADPDGVLDDRDVRDVLEREGVRWDGGGCSK